MSLSATIAPHLPFLRRFSRAVSGSQESGDALVAAMLEAIIADVDIFPEASSDRIALYKVFAKLFTSIAIRVPQRYLSIPARHDVARRCDRAPTLAKPRRRASPRRGRGGRDTGRRRPAILRAAGPGKQRDFPPGGDRRAHHRGRTADRHGHRGAGRRARPRRGRYRRHPHPRRSDAVAGRRRPSLVLADIQLADGSSGIDAVNEIMSSRCDVPVIFITGYPRAAADRRAARARLPDHQAVQPRHGQGC